MSAVERLSFYSPLLSVSYPRKYTVEEYLVLAESSNERLEYVNGFIVKNEAGGSYNHSTISTNVSNVLFNALKGKPCRVHNSDLRIKTQKSFRYADTLVICGEPKFTNNAKNTLTNPTVLVEVVSPESSLRDYVEKRLAYFEIESLQHYIIIEQDAPEIFVYTKNEDDSLILIEYNFKKPNIFLSALGITINVVDIYDDVDFD